MAPPQPLASLPAGLGRLEPVSDTILRWHAPNHSFGPKPMIEVFALWTTSFSHISQAIFRTNTRPVVVGLQV